MNIDDFNFMWRGKIVAPLSERDSHLLLPINIRQRDSGRALLLLHGFSSSPAVYRLLLPELLKMYDAVVCPALPGHANQIDAFAKTSASEWLHAVQQTAQQLAQTYQAIDVMGLSLGGALACQLSESFAINHLFLLAPALSLHGHTRFRLLLAKTLKRLGLKRISNRAGNFHSKGQSELTYRQLPVSAIIEILNLVAHHRFIPPTCPTDVFLGRHDEVVDSQMVAKFFEASPNVHIHWLEHSAHILPLDGDVSIILRHIEDVIHSETTSTSNV